MLGEDDTLVIFSSADLGSEFMQLLHALDYIKHSDINVVVLEGVHNEYFFGITTGQADKVSKDITHMVFNGKIR